VVFHSADADEGGARYYGSLTLDQAMHPQTLLAYEMNGQPLPTQHGAPLRLKVPTQLGYKSTKFIHKIAFVASLEGLAGGKGGYWEDTGYEHYAGI
jgi:DMSO/TMAO reductase YedYZ molybdopterin-dependent catalytic subunit